MRTDEIKEAYEKAKARNEEFAKNPSSPAAKRTARLAGAVLFFAGVVLAGIGYFTWTQTGRVLVLLVAAVATFLGIGLYLMLFGKMPGKKP